MNRILMNTTVEETNPIMTTIDKWFTNGAEEGIATIISYLVIAFILNHILNKIFAARDIKNEAMLMKIKKYALRAFVLAGIFTQISFLSSLIGGLLASSGIAAIIIGLASQEAAGNLVSGCMIYISRPFTVGDTIILKDNNLRGTVIDINLNHTIIETAEKNQIIVPNTIMNKAIIENLTYDESNKIAYLTMDVAYESDLDKAIEIMKEVIGSHPLHINDDPVIVHCTEFKDSAISLRAKVTTRSVSDSFTLCSDCRMQIKKAFDEAGIEIPYPHVQVIK